MELDMKKDVKNIITAALNELEVPVSFDLKSVVFSVDYTKTREHGDVATNVALKLSKLLSRSPQVIASSLLGVLRENSLFEKVEIKGPGFINFFLSADYYHGVLVELSKNNNVIMPNIGDGKKILLEYVSANPTGPLHVGHGRGAAYGSVLASLYMALGYDVVSEYYLNDAGRQMDILAFSVWFRYVELCGVGVAYPDKCYQGAYIIDIAKDLYAEHVDALYAPYAKNMPSMDFALNDSIEDEDQRLDAGIATCKDMASVEIYNLISRHTVNAIRGGIVSDLAAFRVEYDNWFSEKSLYSDGVIDKVFNSLLLKECLYVKDGAYWFAATNWGDEKDRVFKRSSGDYTYFAADLAYHWQKFQHGYNRIIDVFGADHHGYAPRLRAGLKALGLDTNDFEILLLQFANLFRSGQKVSMSTRSGEFVTLSQLYNEVGVDATRYFYSTCKPQQHMDFDLDVAKKKSMDNPVFYVQYAYARICGIFSKYEDSGFSWNQIVGLENLDLLSTEHEQKIMLLLAKYEEVVVASADSYSPHLLTGYLQELASCFHSYYNSVTFISNETNMCGARLLLLSIVSKVIRSGLSLLSVEYPEKM